MEHIQKYGLVLGHRQKQGINCNMELTDDEKQHLQRITRFTIFVKQLNTWEII